MTLTPLSTPVGLDFTHTGDYSAAEAGSPVITVELAARDSRGVLLGATETGVIVDSGAQTTLLGGEIAYRLGLDLSRREQYPQERCGGIVPGQGLLCAKATVMVLLCGRWLEIPAFFTVEPVKIRNLLGREGAFDRVTFAFAHSARTVFGAVEAATA